MGQRGAGIKARGAYYTPRYLVDHMVEQTLGRLLQSCSEPEQVRALRVLDPSCGSGNFLVGAYERLLRWYEEHNPSAGALSSETRLRILQENIFGVDLDARAVEAAQQRLVRAALAGDHADLPDLYCNIRCGNALVGTDFSLRGHPPEPALLKALKPFDWQEEFPHILDAGGFDVVLGNPPYISVERTIKDLSEYYQRTFSTAYGRPNTFALFLERSLALLRPGGYCGKVVPNRLLSNTQLSRLRRLLLTQTTIERLLVFRSAVFDEAVDTVVLILKQSPPTDASLIEIWDGITDLKGRRFKLNRVRQRTFVENPAHLINPGQQESLSGLMRRMSARAVPLDTLCEVRDGIILGSSKDIFLAHRRRDHRFRKWLQGSEVERYAISWQGRHICYDPSLLEQELQRKERQAGGRSASEADAKKLRRPGVWLRRPELFSQPKILTRQNAGRIIGTLDLENFFVKNSLHCILLKDPRYDLRYILGLLNSRALDTYWQNSIGNTGRLFPQIKIAYLRGLPMRRIDFSDEGERRCHRRVAEKVEEVLALRRRNLAAGAGGPPVSLQQQIEEAERRIDDLVDELYDL